MMEDDLDEPEDRGAAWFSALVFVLAIVGIASLVAWGLMWALGDVPK